MTVTPGPRTGGRCDRHLCSREISAGAGHERSVASRADGCEKRGALRSADWDVAKTRLEEALVEVDYAAGALAESRAEVDAESAKAHLRIVVDSGPRFTLGDVEVIGLERYPESVVRRLIDLRRGERYDHSRLIELPSTRVRTGRGS